MVCVVPVHLKAFRGVVLQSGYGIVATLGEGFDSLCSQLCSIKAIEQDGPSSSLCMPHLSGEDRFACGVASAIELKICFAYHAHKLMAQGFCRSASSDVSR